MPRRSQSDGEHFTELVQAIVAGDGARVADLLNRTPTLVHERAATGATRNGAPSYFFEAIRHYLYAGDTALHMAAAAFKPDIAQSLIDRGAECSLKNRRGAEPLH